MFSPTQVRRCAPRGLLADGEKSLTSLTCRFSGGKASACSPKVRQAGSRAGE